MTNRKFLFAGVGVALALVLTGCTNAAGNFPGIPEDHVSGQTSETDTGLQAFWLHEGAQVAVAIWGSSGCPLISTELKVIKPKGEGNTVEAVVTPIPPDKVCTTDYVPHTSVFTTPSQITTTERLTIIVGENRIVLPVK